MYEIIESHHCGFRRNTSTTDQIFNFALENAIRKVQENQVGLKLNGTHQLLAYADDVYLLGDNIDTIKKNMETVIDSCKGGTILYCNEVNITELL
jgi:hypothetical protein